MTRLIWVFFTAAIVAHRDRGDVDAEWSCRGMRRFARLAMAELLD
jgi:hypothetical protein